MPKRNIFRVFLVVIVLLLLAAGMGYYIFIPKKAASLPDFSQMPMDTAGNNMIGNLPENLEAGGFMAGQNGWIYYTNFSDGGALYMCRENGENMTKITDFPVCNINVLGSSLVFTCFYDNGLIKSDSEPSLENNFNNFENAWGNMLMAKRRGGMLCAIYGINSSENPDFCAIDPNIEYFSPYLDRDGLYVDYKLGTQYALVNKFEDTKVVVTREDEAIVKRFSYGGTIYAELLGDNKSRIMRIDAKTLFPIDYINGGKISRVGNNFVFCASKTNYAYEIIPASGEIKPISGVPLRQFEMNGFGEIVAYSDSGPVVVSKEQWYNGAAEVLMSRSKDKPITLQNGWYNYFNAEPRHGGANYFKANDKYYRHDLTWSEPWLNVKLDSKPLVSLDNVTVEDTFTPPWLDYSENAEPIDPAGAEDFGSERPAPATPDNRANASDDAQNALDAAILLLCDDDSIADKYNGESVDKLRNRYGGAFGAAINDAAEELSDTFASKLDTSINPQEMRDIILIWLNGADYSIGEANVAPSGDEAAITLTAANTVDLEMLYSTAPELLLARAESDSSVSQMSAQEKAAWTVDLLVEMMKDPNQYGFVNNQSSDSQIRLAYSDCWFAENPAALIRVLIRGMAA